MQTERTIYISGRSRGLGWKEKLQLALLGLAGGAVLIAAFVFSLALALILVPIGFVAWLFRRALLRAALRRMQAGIDAAAAGGAGAPGRPPRYDEPQRPGPAAGGVTIDADYTVVEPRDRGPSQR
ncbi:hypothetical protein OSH08_02760 [Kaistia geumhonensis]|uniref:Uncharacterized protein n=1 Tax=Kaistia geumhonensis TaxID=410839 RepID=A0ABU0M7D6_9HYPH|nr:hypothetical protein [Kaistia geumhonensis]MCX5477907.1 hypothetical protein [Kaistia geumhonensis]MDQ0516880.1 hypothetical protein [Kaistia geumhonensis]